MFQVVRSATALEHVFNQDSSQTASAQLSLRLHDVYQRAAAAREQIRLTQERRKEEQRDEFRAMLMGIKPPSPVVLDEVRRLGSPRKAGMPDKKALDEEDLQYRREFRERKAHEKDEKVARIRRENMALRMRLKKVGAATDNDVRDDATGLARRKAAEEARQMRIMARERMMQKNAELKARIANATATDDDVAIDAASAARRPAAKKSRQRKFDDAKQNAPDKVELFSIIRSTETAKDCDVRDDVAGDAYRKTTLRRKGDQQQQLHVINRQLRGGLGDVCVVTDEYVSEIAVVGTASAVATMALVSGDDAAAGEEIHAANATLHGFEAAGPPPLTSLVLVPPKKKKGKCLPGPPGKFCHGNTHDAKVHKECVQQGNYHRHDLSNLGHLCFG